MGRTGLPDSYIKYLADRLTGMNFNESLIDDVTLYTFIAALLLSVLFNIRDIFRNYLTCVLLPVLTMIFLLHSYLVPFP